MIQRTKKSKTISLPMLCGMLGVLASLAACDVRPGQLSHPAPVTQMGIRKAPTYVAAPVVTRTVAGSAAEQSVPVTYARGNAYRVQASDTLYAVSRLYKVPVQDLIAENNLSAPYHLAVGQVLRIPSGQRAVTTVTRTETVVATQIKPVIQKETILAAKAPVVPRPTMQSVKISAKGFAWPVQGRVISSYGAKTGGLFNDGINIAAPKGAPVAASADGTVIYVGDDLDTYGNLVLIRHASGVVTAYAHLGSISVPRGAYVVRGQTIGAVGTSGDVSTAQLHFEVRQGKKTLDPKTFL